LYRSARGAAGDGGGPRWLAERVDRHRRASSSPRSWLARASRPTPVCRCHRTHVVYPCGRSG